MKNALQAQVDVSNFSLLPLVQTCSVVQVHPCGRRAAVPKILPDEFGLLYILGFGSVSDLGGTMD